MLKDNSISRLLELATHCLYCVHGWEKKSRHHRGESVGGEETLITREQTRNTCWSPPRHCWHARHLVNERRITITSFGPYSATLLRRTSNTFQRLLLKWHGFLRVILWFGWQINKISTLRTRETRLRTWLIMSVAFGNSRGWWESRAFVNTGHSPCVDSP